MKTVFSARRSIRFQLTAWYAAILIVTFALAGVYVFIAVQHAAEETVDNDLRARLAAVREYLPRESGGEETEALGDALEERAALGPGGVWLQIADSHGKWIYRSDALEDEDATPVSMALLPPRGQTRTTRLHGKLLRVLTAPLGGGVVQIGSPMGEFAEMLENLRWTLSLGIPLLLLLACSGGYWMSGRALKPVDEIARTVEQIGSKTLTERLTQRGTGDELDRLSDTINHMLARLESAFQLVTQFTADASHELRTPVAIIRTTGEVIRASRRTAEEHEAAWNQVVIQTERMSGLIDDLLLLARADTGRSELAFEAMDLAETVCTVTGEMRILAEASGLRLTTSIPSECPMSGDPEAIRRLLLVLLDNAIKYTGAGGEVAVSMRIEEDFGKESCGKRSAIVEVRDTGSGIGAEDLPRIFDRFYRISADRSRKSGGAGLGLSIAKWLACQHGGDIVAESAAGKGSTFRVTLPFDN